MNTTINPTLLNAASPQEVLTDLVTVLSKLRSLDLDAMDAKYLAPLARATQEVCEFAGALDAQINLRVIANGLDVPGVATKPGVAHRKWHNDEAAAQLAREEFGDDAFETKLRSPAQIEKLAAKGKNFVAVASFKPDAPRKVVY